MTATPNRGDKVAMINKAKGARIEGTFVFEESYSYKIEIEEVYGHTHFPKEYWDMEIIEPIEPTALEMISSMRSGTVFKLKNNYIKFFNAIFSVDSSIYIDPEKVIPADAPASDIAILWNPDET